MPIAPTGETKRKEEVSRRRQQKSRNGVSPWRCSFSLGGLSLSHQWIHVTDQILSRMSDLQGEEDEVR